MKNILFGAVMLMGTFAFANTIEVKEINSIQTNFKFETVQEFNGWCEIRIYRGNELIYYSYAPAESEAACELRYKLKYFEYAYGG